MVQLNVGLVGCGGRSKGHVEAVEAHEGLCLAAVADLDEDRAKDAGERYGVKWYRDGREMLAAERPAVACLCTREDARYDLTLAALDAGVKAIVVEKPMARTVGQAREMVRLCQERDVILIVSHQMRFCGEFTAARQALASGEIGKPYFMRTTSYGHLMEQGPHVIDMLLYLLDRAEPEWVMAQVGDVVEGLETVHPAPAFVLGHIVFSNGVRAAVECGRRSQRPVGMEDESWLTKRVEVLGTEGVLDAVVGHHCKLLNTEHPGWQTLCLGRDGWDNATIRFWAELYDSLTTGVLHRNNGAESLRGFEIIHAMYRSALIQERVDLPIPDDTGALETFVERAKTLKDEG